MKTFLRLVMVPFMLLLMTTSSIFAENSTMTVSDEETYSISVYNMPGGSVVTDKTIAAEGELVTLTITPDANYIYGGGFLLFNASFEIIGEYVGETTFTMPAQNVIVIAVFTEISEEPTPHTLTIHYLYLDGTEANESYVSQLYPDAEYNVASPNIVGYTVDNEYVSGTMPWNDVDLYVYYAKNRYNFTINYTYETGGMVYPSYTVSFEYGDDYYFVPSPLSGYMNDPEIIQGTMPAEDVVINVTYYMPWPEYYDIWANDAVNGSMVVVNSSNEYADGYAFAGDLITLTAVPNPGYELDHWEVIDEAGGQVEVFQNQFVMPAATVWVDAYFTEVSSSVVLMQNGTFTACNIEFYDTGGANASYHANDNYTITFMPCTPGSMVKIAFNSFWLEKNYDKMWIYDGTSTAAQLIGTYTDRQLQSTEIIASNADGALTVTFTADRSINRTGWDAIVSSVSMNAYNIECVYDDFYGEIVADPSSAIMGTLVTLSAMPATWFGYEFNGWHVVDANDNEIEVVNNQFVMPASNVTVTADFEYILNLAHYEMITKASELVNGETYIIVADFYGMKFVMGAQDNSTSGLNINYYRDFIWDNVVVIEDMIAVNPDFAEFTLNKSSNRYTFYDANYGSNGGYLYTERSLTRTGLSFTYNYSLGSSKLTSYKYWNITFDQDGAATIRNTSYSKDMGLGDEYFSVFDPSMNMKLYLYKKINPNNRGGQKLIEEVEEETEEEPMVTMFEETSPVEVNTMVYPNPTNGRVTIEARNMKQISVFNVMGQLVYEASERAEKFDIDLSQYTTGIAILRIVTEDGISTQRVIIK